MSTLQQLLEKINAYAQAQPFPDAPANLYEPCDYMLALGGKRLRPAMVLMAYELYRDDPDPALPVAWAVELFHNFSLIHDDIMDAAPLRRGKATVHTKWDTTTGILSGDVMLIYAYHSLTQTNNTAALPALIRTFNRVATGVCEGQQMDIDFEKRSDVSIPEYIHMIELKTAVLLGGALEMGALCAGATQADASKLYEFGRLAGIAFQIQDDLLDSYGDPEKFGKQVGGDILQNKKTLLVLKTLAAASPNDQQALLHWMGKNDGDPDQKIAAVKAIFDRNNIPELMAQEKQAYKTEAFQNLDAIAVPDSRKAALRSVVENLLERDV